MKRFAPVLLCLFVVSASAPQDDKADLAKAAEKTRELEKYAFKGRLSVDGVPFLADPIDYSGSYVKGSGFLASMGPFGSIFRLEKKVAVKDPDSGVWVFLRPGTKVGEGPIAAEIPMVARGLKPPHEELRKFESRFKEIKKRDKTEKIGDLECVVYEGPLTEGGVRAGLPAGVGLLLGKGEYEGTGRAWVGDGRVVKFEADAKAKLQDKDAVVEVSYKRTTEFSDVGKATIEMPPEVKKLFED
jgi:FAD/FMN-containing dehydrogenase